MTQTIAIRTGIKEADGVYSDVKIDEREAEVVGDWATFDAGQRGWSVTHLPSGQVATYAPDKLTALSALNVLQDIEVTCTYDEATGEIEWPCQATEAAELRRVLGQFDWFVPASRQVHRFEEVDNGGEYGN